MSDIILERKRDYYCLIYLLDPVSWNKARITNSLAMGLIAAGMSFFMGLGLIITILAFIVVSIAIAKLTYYQLTKLYIPIANQLKLEFPSFAITLASLLSTYENVTNAFEKAYEYNDNIYYRHLLIQLVEANKAYPQDIDQNIFDFCGEIDSNNATFLAKTLIDFRDKGFDEELLDKLVINLNIENANITKTIVATAADSFVKFGTMPIFLTIIYIFMFVFAMMDAL
ncbi:hypothetical protein RZE82_04425 [Mollicutes bacterium LVI A0039]|nr:hypothetical protein RZE82_04425 [Mollicutes bacterium LVI A0039]